MPHAKYNKTLKFKLAKTADQRLSNVVTIARLNHLIRSIPTITRMHSHTHITNGHSISLPNDYYNYISLTAFSPGQPG